MILILLDNFFIFFKYVNIYLFIIKNKIILIKFLLFTLSI